MQVEAAKVVVSFFELAEEDPRVRPGHLGLYMALLTACIKAGGANPFSISRSRIMRQAKMSSRSTYNQTMRDLMQFGFIRYLPAQNGLSLSYVFLRKLDS
ncbi:hypothetical protein SAMN05444008_105219 [Cnuella takakiae]|uniref:Helix-turn-helix domain-containing protein n=1 Tax=Cnuella takakiae TaxID=1302690 RepID=A0A1M4ZGV7_9BACT|nr:hypothetical protein [Cnuella takakiae]OLY94213.1 hypothetical protein BUE76_21740 [Cnuella takakiae]SHF17269.1 hypothetical protein SAMN05444008_105219 [Cnuella takakiae]